MNITAHVAGIIIRSELRTMLAAMTGERIKIYFRGTEAYTDSKTFISIPEIRPAALYEPHIVNGLRGYASHETFHILYTRSDKITSLIEQWAESSWNDMPPDKLKQAKLLHKVWNFMEDWRIEKTGAIDFPGSHHDIGILRARLLDDAYEHLPSIEDISAATRAGNNIHRTALNMLSLTTTIANGYTCSATAAIMLDHYRAADNEIATEVADIWSRISTANTEVDLFPHALAFLETLDRIREQRRAANTPESSAQTSTPASQDASAKDNQENGEPSDSDNPSSSPSDCSSENDRNTDQSTAAPDTENSLPSNGAPSDTDQNEQRGTSQETSDQSDLQPDHRDQQPDGADADTAAHGAGSQACDGQDQTSLPVSSDPARSSAGQEAGAESDSTKPPDPTHNDLHEQHRETDETYPDDSTHDITDQSRSTPGGPNAFDPDDDDDENSAASTPPGEINDTGSEDAGSAVLTTSGSAGNHPHDDHDIDALPEHSLDMGSLIAAVNETSTRSSGTDEASVTEHNESSSETELNEPKIHHSDITDMDHATYLNIMSSVTTHTSLLSSSIRSLLLSLHRKKTKRNLLSGDLDTSNIVAIATNSPDIYKQTIKGKTVAGSVLFMLDTSYSMNEQIAPGSMTRLELLLIAIGATTEALATARHVETSIRSFTTCHDETGVRPLITIHKTFDDPASRTARAIGSITRVDRYGTPTDHAILDGILQLHRRKTPRRMLILITDGASNHPTSTNEAAAAAISMGIQLIGIGIGKDAPEMNIPGWTSIHEIEELPHKLLNIARSLVAPLPR